MPQKKIRELIRNSFSALGVSLTSAFSEIISTIIVCLSAYYIVKGKMSLGDMIVFYSYLGYMITPLRRFADLNVTYAKSIAGIERVYEILDTEPDIVEKENAITLKPTDHMDIEFRHVSFQYDKQSYIQNPDDITFSRIPFYSPEPLQKISVMENRMPLWKKWKQLPKPQMPMIYYCTPAFYHY